MRLTAEVWILYKFGFRIKSKLLDLMRHTTATHLIEAGVPLAIVKNILGHSSIQTTQIYVDISQQTVDRSMKKWNEKWFSKDSIKEEILPKVQDSMPDFLR